MPNVIIRHNSKLKASKCLARRVLKISTGLIGGEASDYLLLYRPYDHYDIYQTDVAVEIEMLPGNEGQRITRAKEIASAINTDLKTFLVNDDLSISTWVKVFGGGAYIE